MRACWLGVATVLRFDAGPLRTGIRKDARGFLVVPAYVTRVGVFTYLQADGSKVRELRHPDDVFAPKSLATLASAPVTDRHPAEPVGPENVRALEKGVAGEARRDGIYVASDLSVRDADMIGKVERKDAVECSCGYSCDIVPESGEYDGQRYDQRQTNITYNHVGLGPKGWGRAGAETRLRMDSAAAVLEEPEEQREDSGHQPERKRMKTIRVDGKDYEVSDDVAGLVGGLQDKVGQVQKELDREKGRADAAEGDVKKLQKDLAEAKDPKKRADEVAALVAAQAARGELEKVAGSVLGAEFKADGKSDRDVRVAVLTKLDPEFKADGKSDDYVIGSFERTLKSTAGRNDGLTLVQTVIAAAQQSGPTGEFKADGKTYEEAVNARASHNPFAKAGN
jgi:hypothetical protein